MVKKWVDDIREKTKGMGWEGRAEYVMAYYWYHILLTALFLGLCILLAYHIGWGNRKMDFSLVLVNQEVDFARDKALAKDFAQHSGIRERRISVDSDYLISYGGVELEGINESSYEKFFFNWMSGSIDGAVMPKSFARYCKSQNGEFAEVSQLLEACKNASAASLPGKSGKGIAAPLYWENGEAIGVYLEGTRLGQCLECDPKDPVVLVFPKEMPRREACAKFLAYILEEVCEKPSQL